MKIEQSEGKDKKKKVYTRQIGHIYATSTVFKWRGHRDASIVALKARFWPPN